MSQHTPKSQDSARSEDGEGGARSEDCSPAPADPWLEMPGALPLSRAEFQLLSKLVHQSFGIHLSEEKRALIVNRLQHVVRDHGLDSFAAYHELLLQDRDGALLAELANRITTNHTFFYREKAHFDFFQEQALPEALQRCRDRGNRDLRVWCAGCATGEEAYLLVMLTREYLGQRYALWDAGALATDLSAATLEKARQGIYSRDRLRLLPAPLRQRYLQPLDAQHWQVTDELRHDITFRRFNLITHSYPFRRPFDIVFCRNVMIYFDLKTRAEVARRLLQVIVPGGYLIIGHSESLHQLKTGFAYIKPGVYQRPLAS